MSLTTNLIEYWKLDGNSSGSLGNYSGTDTAISYVSGKINQAASFNGTTSVISNPNLTQLQGATKMSISLWLNLNSANFWSYVSVKGTNNNCFDIRYNGTVGFGVAIHMWTTLTGSDTVFRNSAIGSGLTVGSWSHLVIVYDGTQAVNTDRLKMYINGSFITMNFGGTVPTALTSSTAALRFGNDIVSGSKYSGLMDEVGIWSRDLSSTEVTQLYNLGTGLSYPFGSGNSNFFNFL